MSFRPKAYHNHFANLTVTWRCCGIGWLHVTQRFHIVYNVTQCTWPNRSYYPWDDRGNYRRQCVVIGWCCTRVISWNLVLKMPWLTGKHLAMPLLVKISHTRCGCKSLLVWLNSFCRDPVCNGDNAQAFSQLMLLLFMCLGWKNKQMLLISLT